MSSMFVLEMSISKIGFNIMLPSTVKKVVAQSDNTALIVQLCL